MRYLLATLALTATPAHANTEREIAFQVLNAADAIETCDFLHRGVAHELNPLVGKHPSCETVIAYKVAAGGVHYFLVWELEKRDPKLAKVVDILTIALQGGVVVANLRFVF